MGGVEKGGCRERGLCATLRLGRRNDESGGSPREDLEIREPLLCKAEAPSEHSKGWEQAACVRNEDGHIHRFYWNQPASFHTFTIPNVTHPSICIIFLRISSTVSLAVSSNRAKTQMRGILLQ